MKAVFTDLEIMENTLKRIEQGAIRFAISAEHYTWLAGLHGTLLAIVDAAGGKVEGHPTSTINILQRIRELREFTDTYPGTWETWRLGIENRRANGR